MRKTVAFLACVAVVAGALFAAGCKPRNIKQLIMPYVPSPAPAVAACELSGSYVFSSSRVEIQVEDTDIRDYYDVCGAPNDNQRVYEIQVTEGGSWFEIYGAEFNGPYGLTLLSSCEVDADNVIACGDPGIYFGSDQIDPGTYYLVVNTPSGVTGWVEINWD